MDRKEFLKNSCCVTAAFSTLMALGAPARAEEPQEKKPEDAAADRKRQFTEGWVKAMMESLDATLPEEARVKVMETSGRSCATRGGMVKNAQSFGGDVDKFLAMMRQHLGEQAAVRDGKKVRLVFGKCYCPLVAEMKDKLSPTYCNCSRGWVMAVLEAASGAPVTVELQASVKRGDPECRLVVELA